MQFTEELPHGFSTHSALGEHAPKFIHDGTAVEYARLCQVAGVPTPIKSREDFSERYGVRGHGEFVPIFTVAGDGRWTDLIAAGTTRVISDGNVRLAELENLVTHPDYRNRGIASFVLSRLIVHADEYFGAHEVRVSSDVELPLWLPEKLDQLGFVDDGTGPSLYLPGQDIYVPYWETDVNVDALRAKIPSTWVGVLRFCDEEGYEVRELYRSGKLVGVFHRRKLFDGSGALVEENLQRSGYSPDIRALSVLRAHNLIPIQKQM